MNCTETWLRCSESCGEIGVQTCVSHCKEYEISSGILVKEFDASCGTKNCFINCETTAQVSGKCH